MRTLPHLHLAPTHAIPDPPRLPRAPYQCPQFVCQQSVWQGWQPAGSGSPRSLQGWTVRTGSLEWRCQRPACPLVGFPGLDSTAGFKGQSGPGLAPGDIEQGTHWQLRKGKGTALFWEEGRYWQETQAWLKPFSVHRFDGFDSHSTVLEDTKVWDRAEAGAWQLAA